MALSMNLELICPHFFKMHYRKFFIFDAAGLSKSYWNFQFMQSDHPIKIDIDKHGINFLSGEPDDK